MRMLNKSLSYRSLFFARVKVVFIITITLEVNVLFFGILLFSEVEILLVEVDQAMSTS